MPLKNPEFYFNNCYQIIDDNGSHQIYHKRNFVTLEEHRVEKLKELGIWNQFVENLAKSVHL